MSEYNQPWNGIFGDLRRRYIEAWGDQMKANLEKFMSHDVCSCCHGKRLRSEALGVTVGGKNIYELTCLSIGRILEFFDNLKLLI